MQDVIQEFIDYMSSCGLSPKRSLDIKGDNTRRNYQSFDDKPSKKTCFYKLSIDGDFGYGYFGSYKTDEYFSFCSKSSRKYSRSEIEKIRRDLDAEKNLEIENREKTYLEKSKEVIEFLFFLDPTNDHKYLKKKKLPHGFGAYHSGSYLIIPMVDFDKTWNYQRINESGDEKKYYDGARKTGTWFCINGEVDTIYITEGFATGATVHMATGQTVLVAFDSGNLLPVVQKVISKYPNASIVIAADNDHEAMINGKPYNTGLIKAKQIAALYPNVKYKIPEFKDGAGLTDFNDLYVAQGLQEVVNQLLGLEKAKADIAAPKQKAEKTPQENQNCDKEGRLPAVKEATPEEPIKDQKAGEQRDDAWRSQLILNKNGLVPTSTVNARLILENSKELDGVYKYDDFAKHIIVHRCPPWEDEANFTVRPIQDYDYLRLECFLEAQWSLRINKNKCADLIESTALLEKNTFNPAKEYFENLEWDKRSRLDTWLLNYVSDGTQSEEYLRLVGRKFMCGLAARAMYPGIKFDTMVIFEGEQYAGKSFLSRIIGTAYGVEYFLDDFKDIENKDALMKMQGKLVVEFPEISTMRKAEVNDLKAFVTRQTDEFRPPYGRNVITSKRQCVFIGTVNPEGAYFKDMTGNRRYWPISCRRRLKLPELKEIMHQLHAEAAHLIKNGEQLWLNEDEYKLAQYEQNKRVISDLWIDKIDEIIGQRQQITTDELLTDLGIKTEQRNNMVFNRLQQVMHSLGWMPTRIKIGTKRKRGFILLQDMQKDMLEEEIQW